MEKIKKREKSQKIFKQILRKEEGTGKSVQGRKGTGANLGRREKGTGKKCAREEGYRCQPR
jgi:hypothetical protein